MPAVEEPNPPGTASLRILLGMQSTQKHIRLDLPPTTTCLDIKKKIMKMEEIPEEEELHLIYIGEKIKDTEALSAKGITAGPDKVHMLLIWALAEKHFKALADAAKKAAADKVKAEEAAKKKAEAEAKKKAEAEAAGGGGEAAGA